MTRVWNVGIKTADVAAEVEFHRRLGHEVVIEMDSVAVPGRETPQAQSLVLVGDKYLVITNDLSWEANLPEPLPDGVSHVSYSVDDIAVEFDRAVEAGAQVIMTPQRIEGTMGSRTVAALRSPGGALYCLFQIHTNRVPEV